MEWGGGSEVGWSDAIGQTIAYSNHGQASGYLAVTEKPRLLKITTNHRQARRRGFSVTAR
jgi:hypothetical protein